MFSNTYRSLLSPINQHDRSNISGVQWGYVRQDSTSWVWFCTFTHLAWISQDWVSYLATGRLVVYKMFQSICLPQWKTFVQIETSEGLVLTFLCSGSAMDQVQSYFVGSGPQLINDDVIASGSDRYRLQTIASGTVYLSLFLVTRNFNKFGIESWNFHKYNSISGNAGKICFL